MATVGQSNGQTSSENNIVSICVILPSQHLKYTCMSIIAVTIMHTDDILNKYML